MYKFCSLYTMYTIYIHKCGKVKKIKDNNVSKAVLQCIPLNEIFLTTFCITASRIVERHSNSSLYFNFMPDIKITWNPYLLENLIKSHTTKSIKPHSKSSRQLAAGYPPSITLCALPCLGLGLWLTLTVYFDLA